MQLIFHPFIKVAPVSEREFRDQKVHIEDHTAVIFSSRHAIDHYFRMCKETRFKVPDEMQYYGISEKVMLYIQKFVQYRKRRVFFSSTGHWPELMTSIMKHKNERFLIPQNVIREDELTHLLDEKKINYTQCVMYRTVPNTFSDGTTLSDFDAVLLFTPSGVNSLVQNFPNWDKAGTKLVCFGDTTCAAAEQSGLHIDYSPDKSKVSSIAAALEAFIQQENG